MILVGADIGSLFTFEDQRVVFDEGMTVLVGANGAGKTVLGVEVACWTLWGKTARGVEPVPDGEASVLVRLPGGQRVAVARKRAGNKLSSLALTVDDQPRSCQTPTETQARIDTMLGDWRLFSSTRVFSRALLARFSTSPNKERGKLLEAVLGLERFTRAEKEAVGARALRRSASLVAEGRVRECQASLERSREAAATSPEAVDVAALRGRLAEVKRGESDQEIAREAASKKLGRMQVVLQSARDAVAAAKNRIEFFNRDVEKLRGMVVGEAAECPTCLQPVTALAADRATRSLRKQEAASRAALERETEVLAVAQAELADQQDAFKRAEAVWRGPWQDFAGERRDLEQEIARAEGAGAQAEKLRKMVDIDTKRVATAELEAAKAARDLRVAEAACAALGPRGARLRAFSRSIGTINAEVRRVIAKLGLGIGVKIVGSADEVAVEVEGAGGGRYLGASDGERARIDVAILLAMARAAGAAGLLVFDEVFDPLDDEGVERVAELLREMARERQVVVTSHSPRLLALLPRALTWRVEKVGGKSKVVQGA